MDSYEKALKDVGLRLKKLRENAGYTSYENFAIQNEFSRMQYWRLENGKVNLTFRSLLSILAIHKLSIEAFFELDPATGKPFVHAEKQSAARQKIVKKQRRVKKKSS